MKRPVMALVGVLFAFGPAGRVIAGSMDYSAPPSSGSGMYTLQNLYEYLTHGTALTIQSGFEEPSAAPASTMKSARQIGDEIKAVFESCAGTTADNVESGRPFFCTQPGSWGMQTGTLAQLPRPTRTPTPTMTPTATPTVTPTVWDAAACAAKGGTWAPDGLGYGCWFNGAAGVSCNSVCASNGGLSCMAGNWYDPGCAVCLAGHPGNSCYGYDNSAPYHNTFVTSECWGSEGGDPRCSATWTWRELYCVCTP